MRARRELFRCARARSSSRRPVLGAGYHYELLRARKGRNGVTEVSARRSRAQGGDVPDGEGNRKVWILQICEPHYDEKAFIGAGRRRAPAETRYHRAILPRDVYPNGIELNALIKVDDVGYTGR